MLAMDGPLPVFKGTDTHVMEAFAQNWLAQWGRGFHIKGAAGAGLGGRENAEIYTKLLLSTESFRVELKAAKGGSVLGRLMLRHGHLFEPNSRAGVIHREPVAALLFLQALKMLAIGDIGGVQLALEVALSIEPDLAVALELRSRVAQGYHVAWKSSPGFRCDAPISFVPLRKF